MDRCSHRTWTLVVSTVQTERTRWLSQQPPGLGREPGKSPAPSAAPSSRRVGGGALGVPGSVRAVIPGQMHSVLVFTRHVFSRHIFLLHLSFLSSQTQQSQTWGARGRLYLCFFWSIEHFLSLFNIFQISGDCFPPLDGVWAVAKRNTGHLPRPRVRRRSRGLKFLLNLASPRQIYLH